MKKVLEGTKRVFAMLMVVLMVFGLVPSGTVEVLAENGELTPNTLTINMDERKADIQVTEDGGSEVTDTTASGDNVYVYTVAEGKTYTVTFTGKTVNDKEEIVYGVYEGEENVTLEDDGTLKIVVTAEKTAFSYDVKFVSDATTKVTANYKSSEIRSVTYDNGITPETTETGDDKTTVFSVVPGEKVKLVVEPKLDGAAVVTDKGTSNKNGEETSYIVALDECKEDTVVNLSDDMIALEVTVPDTVTNVVVVAGEDNITETNGVYNIKKESETHIEFKSSLSLNKLVAKLGGEDADITEVSEGIYKIELGEVAADTTVTISEKEFPKVTINYDENKVSNIKVLVDGEEVAGEEGTLEFDAVDEEFEIKITPTDPDAEVKVDGYTVVGESGERTLTLSNITTATVLTVEVVDVYTVNFEGTYSTINRLDGDGNVIDTVADGKLFVKENETDIVLQIIPETGKYISELQKNGEDQFSESNLNLEDYSYKYEVEVADSDIISVDSKTIAEVETKPFADVLVVTYTGDATAIEEENVYYINENVTLALTAKDTGSKLVFGTLLVDSKEIIETTELTGVTILTKELNDSGFSEITIQNVNFEKKVKFVVDNTNPSISVDTNNTTEYFGPNKKDVLITGYVSDANFDRVVYFTTEPTGDAEILDINAPKATIIEKDESNTFEINTSATGEADVQYYVYAIDKAGNYVRADITVKCDNTMPTEGSIEIVNVTAVLNKFPFVNTTDENMKPIIVVKVVGITDEDDGSGISEIRVAILDENNNPLEDEPRLVDKDNKVIFGGIVKSGEVYKFKVIATDNVGNTREILEIETIINNETYTQVSHDGTPPLVTVTPDVDTGANGVYVPQNEDGKCYINGTVLDSFKLKIIANDYLGDKKTVPYISGLAEVIVKINGDEYIVKNYDNILDPNASELFMDELEINLKEAITTLYGENANKEGTYVITVDAMDNVGNKYENETFTVYVDETAPEVSSVAVNNAPATWDEEFEEYKFKFITNGVFAIDIDGVDDETDSDSGVAYYTVETIEEDKIGSPSRVETANAVYTITQNYKGTLRITAYDKVGNVSEPITLKDGLICEKENTHASNAGVTLSTAETSMKDVNGIKLYADNTSVGVVVTDTYAGIELIEWSVVAPNDTANNKSGKMPADDLASGWTANATDNGVVTKVSGSIPVSNNSNSIVVKVTITDNAGNTSTSNVVVSIDKTAPTINVSVAGDDADSQYTSTFNGDRVATITIRERNFKSSDVKVTITNTDGVIPSVTTWTKKEDASNPDNNTYTATVTFAADGDYTLDVAYTDLAKRTATAPAQQKLTIDKTVPETSVSIDGNASNGYYFATGRTATIVVNEHNFDSSRVQLTGTATNNGAAVSIPSISSWSTSGDTHTATVRFTEDADYQLVLSGIDQAGNTFTYEVPNFVIDQVVPTITISGVENQSANAGDVVPVITLGDVNYDTNGVNITLVGANNGSMELNGSFSNTADGQVFTFSNFPNEKNYDDIYTLTATKTDMAGNETVETITFSVNRFGSVYTFSDELKEVVGKYVKQPFEIVLTETNIDRLDPASIKVVLTVNGTPKTLVLDVDYTISQSGSDASWKQYVYTINPSVFEGDGSYSLALYSVDGAGNVNENINEVKEAEVIFGIDSTAPVVEAINFENGFTNQTAYTATISAIDNIIMKAVKVLINGEEVEVTADGDMYTFVIPESGSRQNVTVIATDEAGNETRMEYTDILITSNVFVSFFNNTPLLIGSIAGVVAVGGGAGAFVFFRRRNVVKIKK